MKKTIIDLLREDKEITAMRKEWVENYKKSFLLFNFDEFSSIDEYKERLKSELDKLRKENK